MKKENYPLLKKIFTEIGLNKLTIQEVNYLIEELKALQYTKENKKEKVK